MIAIAVATHLGINSFLISRIVQKNVCVILHREDGSERVISSRPYKLSDLPETRWEYDYLATWLLLFAYNKNRSLVMTITPTDLHKTRDTWETDLNYTILNKEGSVRDQGTFHNVPVYGDQLFGMDDVGRAYLVRFEGKDQVKVWDTTGYKILNTHSLPRSLQILTSNEAIEKTLPKWPNRATQKIKVKPELIPQNESWQTIGFSMPQIDSEIRTSVSAYWNSSLVYTENHCYLKSKKLTTAIALDRKFFSIQACKYPFALASYVEPINEFRISSDFLRFQDSTLYILDAKNNTSTKLCTGVIGIQM